ncbi:hypothetical protein BJF83_17450 [Nocardiopsis sp. CNR-923]|uniref:hypothetical protein n=1 Tax=Nocardiopsis sp. CNR-923 TaxID=1904965 RepID=UPI0009691E1C|nr:hypothetical protein [Nocardiopsis sp. CNR-923]OLT27769.1 hypothetical protein BJF83_17450 [Nocardiopsis sp. CNR-923]
MHHPAPADPVAAWLETRYDLAVAYQRRRTRLDRALQRTTAWPERVRITRAVDATQRRLTDLGALS